MPNRAAEVASAAGVAAGAVAIGIAGQRRQARRENERAERVFRLHPEEPAAAGIRRLARGQIDLAIEQLRQGIDRDPAEAVHQARKALKRCRAVVRLARGELGDEVYRRENAAFRDTGRRLSGTRDSEVMVETLEALCAGHDDEIRAGTFEGLRAQLLSEKRAATERLHDDSALIEETLADLEAARTRVAGWVLDDDAVEALVPGLERVYRRGRRALGEARDEPTDEALHELRKRAKDLWHGAQILRPVAPKRMKKLGRRAHEVSDLAGEDHDLAVLRTEAHRRWRCFENREALTALDGLIERRRAALQPEAIAAGKRIYRAKPGAFSRTVRSRAQAL